MKNEEVDYLKLEQEYREWLSRKYGAYMTLASETQLNLLASLVDARYGEPLKYSFILAKDAVSDIKALINTPVATKEQEMENEGSLQRITRCKDCKFWKKYEGDDSGICNGVIFDEIVVDYTTVENPEVYTQAEHFCAVGEDRISECDGTTYYESIPDDEVWNPYSK